jgi:hypothetical protein
MVSGMLNDTEEVRCLTQLGAGEGLQLRKNLTLKPQSDPIVNCRKLSIFAAL